MEIYDESKIPKVSIGLAVYNGEDYLRESLDSLLAQTFEDFELIISDNASTDSTAQICQEYVEKDDRIRYHRNPKNLGGAVNMNLTIELARGEYFKLAAHDDNCGPNFLARCVSVLEQNPSIVLAYPETVLIDESGTLLTEPNPDDNDAKYVRLMNSKHYVETDVDSPVKRFKAILESYHYWYPVFGVVRTDVLKTVPWFGTYPGGDQALLARLSLRGKFHEVPEKLFFMRRHASQSINIGAISPQLYCTWYASSNSGKLLMPFWEKFWDYNAAIQNAPLNTIQRVEARAYLARSSNWKAMIKDLAIASLQIADYFKRSLWKYNSENKDSLLLNRYPRVTQLF